MSDEVNAGGRSGHGRMASQPHDVVVLYYQLLESIRQAHRVDTEDPLLLVA